MKTFKKSGMKLLKHPTSPWSDLFSVEQEPNGTHRELLRLDSVAQPVASGW